MTDKKSLREASLGDWMANPEEMINRAQQEYPLHVVVAEEFTSMISQCTVLLGPGNAAMMLAATMVVLLEKLSRSDQEKVLEQLERDVRALRSGRKTSGQLIRGSSRSEGKPDCD